MTTIDVPNFVIWFGKYAGEEFKNAPYYYQRWMAIHFDFSKVRNPIRIKFKGQLDIWQDQIEMVRVHI